jgi:hypothetical protein
MHWEEEEGEGAVLLRLDAGLAEQGLGLAQVALLTLVATATFTSGLELYLLSLVGLDMQCFWHVSPSQAAALFTLVSLMRALLCWCKSPRAFCSDCALDAFGHNLNSQ